MYYKNAGPIHVPAVIGNEKKKKKVMFLFF